jgi:hypothetical protein
VKLRSSRNGSDAIAAKLRDLTTLPVKHVNESAHVADGQLLNVVIRLALPMGLQSANCEPYA